VLKGRRPSFLEGKAPGVASNPSSHKVSRAPEENCDLGNFDAEDDTTNVVVYFINGEHLMGCPHVKLNMAGKEVVAVLDSGAEISVLSGELYNYIKSKEVRMLEVPVIGGVLLSAWGSKTKRIRTQALIEFQIDCVQYEHTFISPELTAEAILVANSLNDYEVF
jgi:hypothetical protein